MTKEKSIGHLRQKLGLMLLISMPISVLAAGVDSGLTESLRQALEAQGWQAERAEDGSIIYRQSSVPAAKGEMQPAVKNQRSEDLADTLEQRGWQMQWSPNGSLVLRPQSQAAQASPEAASKAEVKPADRLPDLPGFEYWRIEKQDDGSVRFHPLAKTAGSPAAAMQAVTLGRCEGIEIQNAAIQLPVDQWNEAKALAQGWLSSAGLQGLLVGRIRRVLGIYLVSLVEGSPPYLLKHQLAIRASDGRVILLQ